MIYAPVTTPAALLAALPDLLETEAEAAELLGWLQEEKGDTYLDNFAEEAHLYGSVSDAFFELYEGSIEAFKAEKCEDYGISTSSFSDFYADWLNENYDYYPIGKRKIIVLQ